MNIIKVFFFILHFKTKVQHLPTDTDLVCALTMQKVIFTSLHLTDLSFMTRPLAGCDLPVCGFCGLSFDFLKPGCLGVLGLGRVLVWVYMGGSSPVRDYESRGEHGTPLWTDAAWGHCHHVFPCLGWILFYSGNISKGTAGQWTMESCGRPFKKWSIISEAVSMCDWWLVGTSLLVLWIWMSSVWFTCSELIILRVCCFWVQSRISSAWNHKFMFVYLST